MPVSIPEAGAATEKEHAAMVASTPDPVTRMPVSQLVKEHPSINDPETVARMHAFPAVVTPDRVKPWMVPPVSRYRSSVGSVGDTNTVPLRSLAATVTMTPAGTVV